MLLKDETQHVYETVKFWKIIPQIYRHMYTHLTTNEKPFLIPKTTQKEETAFPSYYFEFCQSERLFTSYTDHHVTQLFAVKTVAKC